MKRILGFHVRFEQIRPFEDYNGRVGRLIIMKECLRHGILAWSQDHVPMMSLVESAQKRFQAKAELCALFQYARYPEPYRGGKL